MTDPHRRIPYCVPSWGWREHIAILKGLMFGQIIKGPHIQALYTEVRSITNIPFVFGFDSGESAITACLKASGIGAGDDVIMPSFCCHSVAEAILGTGAAPRFCEIQHDLNPDVSDILSLIQPSVKAIIFPHLFGRPGDIEVLEEELIKKRIRDRLLLIDDAAQSFGAKINGRYLGSFGDAGIISFGAGKMTTASGGGLLITRSESLAKKINALAVASHGLVHKLKQLSYWTIFRRWRKYSIWAYRYLGFLFRNSVNANEQLRSIADIDAAIALTQIARLDHLISARRSIKQKFDQAIVEIRQLCSKSIESLGDMSDGFEETYTKHIFFFSGIDQATDCSDIGTQKFYSHLKQSGIELQPLYALLHLDPKYGRKNKSLPYSEKRIHNAMNLCTDPTLTKKDIAHITATMKSFLKQFSSKTEDI